MSSGKAVMYTATYNIYYTVRQQYFYEADCELLRHYILNFRFATDAKRSCVANSFKQQEFAGKFI